MRTILLLALSFLLLAQDVPVLDYRSPQGTKVCPNAVKTTAFPGPDGATWLRLVCDTDKTWPGVGLYPPKGTWDWRRFQRLVMDVRNPGTEQVQLYLRVENAGAADERHCNLQQITLAPGAAGTMTVVFSPAPEQPLPLKLFGMRGPPAVVRHDRQIDLERITAVQITLSHPRGARVVEVGPPRLVPATGEMVKPLDKAGFIPFIDTYGQYRHADWPAKIRGPSDLAKAVRDEAADLARQPGPAGWNRFGGWSAGPQLEATGAFRTQKHQDRWWLVDPEGRLFFSHGIDCVVMSVATAIENRESWFQGIDALPPEFKSCFETTRVHMGHYQGRTVRTFDLGEANLMRRYGADWRRESVALAHRRLRSWGMNTIANWSDHDFTKPGPNGMRTPYTATATIWAKEIAGSGGYWGRFKDVFDPEFPGRTREALRWLKEVANDPWCIGVFVDNELSWGKDVELAIGTLASPASQAAKQAMLADLKGKYGDIAKLNAAWGTAHASWEALGGSTKAPDATRARADLEAFTSRIADRYFSVVAQELRSVAPRRLYLGCRFMSTKEAPLAVAAAARHCDVISWNIYETGIAGFRQPITTDKPMIVGEFQFGTTDRGMFHHGAIRAVDQTDRARLYRDYVTSALRHPHCVGAHWFQYRDEAATGRPFDEENFQIGFVDVCDTTYPEMVAASRDLGTGMYALRAGGATSGRSGRKGP